jgi:hypothetical protein
MSELFADSKAKRLKLRLLGGSIVVAILTSAIFLAIAYRLASDMGRDIYQSTAISEANTILQLVRAQASNGDAGQKLDPATILHELFSSKEFGADFLQLKVGNLSKVSIPLATRYQLMDRKLRTSGIRSGLSKSLAYLMY